MCPSGSVMSSARKIGKRRNYQRSNSLIADEHVRSDQKIQAFFAAGSADLELVVQKNAFQDETGDTFVLYTRNVLELEVSKNLWFILDPGVSLVIVGYASPEGPGTQTEADKFNKELSEQRADVVFDALLTAVGTRLGGTKDVAVLPLGSEPSFKVLKEKPPSTTLNRAAFLAWVKKHKSDVLQWPEWRRADLLLEGIGTLKLFS